MVDPQTLLFRAAMRWSDLTAVVVFALGLLYMLQGFRFSRILLAMLAGCGGFVLGGVLAQVAGLPPSTGAVLVAALLCIISLWRIRVGVVLASTFTLAALGYYLAFRLGLRGANAQIALLVGALAGATIYWIHRRAVPSVATTLCGSALLVVGFVGIAANLTPSMADSFVRLSSNNSAVCPVLLLMLTITGFSFQSNSIQGEIETGGHGWNKTGSR